MTIASPCTLNKLFEDYTANRNLPALKERFEKISNAAGQLKNLALASAAVGLMALKNPCIGAFSIAATIAFSEIRRITYKAAKILEERSGVASPSITSIGELKKELTKYTLFCGRFFCNLLFPQRA